MNWAYNVPNGWRRVLAAQAKGADLIVVDPRRTPTAEKADTHLAVRPGQDWALLLGILKVVFDHGWEHREDCSKLNGLDAVRELAAEADLEDLARRCGIAVVSSSTWLAGSPSPTLRFATPIRAESDRTRGMGSSNHPTGRVDRPEGGGSSQATPARSTCGTRWLPKRTTLGCGDCPPWPLSRSPSWPTKSPFPGRGGPSNAGNPVVSAPDGHKLDAALASLELLVAIDLVQRESHRHAHWLIPDTPARRDDLLALFSQCRTCPGRERLLGGVDQEEATHLDTGPSHAPIVSGAAPRPQGIGLPCVVITCYCVQWALAPSRKGTP